MIACHSLISLAAPSPDAVAMVKRQCIHTLLPRDRVNANHWRLAGEFDRRDNRVELGSIEIVLELIARFPFFNEQKRFSFIEVREETDRETAGRYPRRLKD
jgi:hypothetical protein